MLLSYKNTSSFKRPLHPVIPSQPLVISFPLFPTTVCHYRQLFICASLFSPPHVKWGMWFCMSPLLLLRWVFVWGCYQAAVYEGQGLHGSLCFTCLCWRCRGASITRQLLQELSYKGWMQKECRKWSHWEKKESVANIEQKGFLCTLVVNI